MPTNRVARSVAAAFVCVALTVPAGAQRFYPDDPLLAEPPLMPTMEPGFRDLSGLLEMVSNTFGEPGERHPANGVIPAGGVNTLGEVMDGPWFVNRHGRSRMTRAELQSGPGNGRVPSTREPFRVLTVKPFGTLPGVLIADAEDELYLLQYDAPEHPEMVTGAAMVTERFFHALGYHVPESYLVVHDRSQLVAAEGAQGITSLGQPRELIEIDIDNFLRKVAEDPPGRYRAVATRVPGRWTNLIGTAQVYGTRSDDPNDIVPHEHRRDLRGLFVFSAWLNYIEAAAENIIDVYMAEAEPPHIRHFLVDFGATLGSGGLDGPKRARQGNDPYFDGGRAMSNLIGMGIFSRGWMRASYPKHRSIGRFEYERFDPEAWIPDAMIAPFANRLPDDEFWAARQVMAFTDDDIAAIVEMGEYSDPEAAAWLVRCLIERRGAIGRTYFAKILPLDRFRVEGGLLRFDDLGVEHGFAEPRTYTVQWSTFDNMEETHSDIGTASAALRIPAEARGHDYVAARIWAAEPEKAVTVYLRQTEGDPTVVGIERSWPGKVLADPSLDEDTGLTRSFAELHHRQRELIERLAEDYNAEAERDLTAEEFYDTLTVSERTTFDGVTHALRSSKLTDAETGDSLGTAMDLVDRLERIAGQYYGRSGDQQFRLYVHLVEGARETLDRSKEFFLGHENTVYHVGYPHSYRQEGTVPNMQFSVSEDGLRADIDVDYRSSKSPQALFNGHLTSANSDVRAGDNHKRHSKRWAGLIAWWRQVFGELAAGVEDGAGSGREVYSGPELVVRATPLPPDRVPGTPIPEFTDAAQEFLTDWLVRGNIDHALHFISDDLLACLNANDDVREEILAGADARDMLRRIMTESREHLGKRRNLTEAIEAVSTWDEDDTVIEHPYSREFEALDVATSEARKYLCKEPESFASLPERGVYFANLLRFRTEGSGVLGLLWVREDGVWKIVSYEVFSM